MALSVFDDKAHPPETGELETVLGRTSGTWNKLVAAIMENYAPIDEVWAFAGAKFGWSLRLRRRERVILYLTPQKGHFLAGIVLGRRAVAEAERSALPAPVLQLIHDAREYAEGRGIRLPVKSAKDLAVVLELAALKMQP